MASPGPGPCGPDADRAGPAHDSATAHDDPAADDDPAAAHDPAAHDSAAHDSAAHDSAAHDSAAHDSAALADDSSTAHDPAAALADDSTTAHGPAAALADDSTTDDRDYGTVTSTALSPLDANSWRRGHSRSLGEVTRLVSACRRRVGLVARLGLEPRTDGLRA